MSIEFAVITALVSMAIGVAGFFGGKIAAAKKAAGDDAATITAIKKDIEKLSGDWSKDMGYLQKDIGSLQKTIENNQTSTDESIRRLHDRIDDHVKEYHGVSVQK